MNRKQVMEFNSALNDKGLKVKHVSGSNFLKLIKLKSLLMKELGLLIEGEQALAVEYEIREDNGQYVASRDELVKAELFSKAIKSLQEAYTLEGLELNFIPEDEFVEYVKECDTRSAAILLDYLLKPS